ncbi:hypothetical protein EDB89DRAFT_1901696 [Lactarius sanguifluus]|nr:hypothetical protein EDB89DRAFT_1901696 [Lactarius sanguifluus]
MSTSDTHEYEYSSEISNDILVLDSYSWRLVVVKMAVVVMFGTGHVLAFANAASGCMNSSRRPAPYQRSNDYNTSNSDEARQRQCNYDRQDDGPMAIDHNDRAMPVDHNSDHGSIAIDYDYGAVPIDLQRWGRQQHNKGRPW